MRSAVVSWSSWQIGFTFVATRPCWVLLASTRIPAELVLLGIMTLLMPVGGVLSPLVNNTPIVVISLQ